MRSKTFTEIKARLMTDLAVAAAYAALKPEFAARRAALDALTAEAQEMGLYDDPQEPVP